METPETKSNQEQIKIFESDYKENIHANKMEFSPTVRGVIDSIREGETISAARFAEEILKRHSEYAGQKASIVLPLKETQQRNLVTLFLRVHLLKEDH